MLHANGRVHSLCWQRHQWRPEPRPGQSQTRSQEVEKAGEDGSILMPAGQIDRPPIGVPGALWDIADSVALPSHAVLRSLPVNLLWVVLRPFAYTITGWGMSSNDRSTFPTDCSVGEWLHHGRLRFDTRIRIVDQSVRCGRAGAETQPATYWMTCSSLLALTAIP